MRAIDINFDFYSDTPAGKDPDSYSPTLRRYHKILWSKPLPNGHMFQLEGEVPKALHHRSHLGEFFLSSDAIGHTYSRVKKMSDIVNQIPQEEIDSFFSVCSTIGAYVVFPCNKIDNKMTINGARGLNRSIADRFDLTLECIRRFYINESSPLTDTLRRYSDFFHLFQSFKEYVEFFLLQDMVSVDCSEIMFWHPFAGFEQDPLPKSVAEYRDYRNKLMGFVAARNHRVQNYSMKLSFN